MSHITPLLEIHDPPSGRSLKSVGGLGKTLTQNSYLSQWNVCGTVGEILQLSNEPGRDLAAWHFDIRTIPLYLKRRNEQVQVPASCD